MMDRQLAHDRNLNDMILHVSLENQLIEFHLTYSLISKLLILMFSGPILLSYDLCLQDLGWHHMLWATMTHDHGL